jgi:tellurite resistance protein TerC
MQDRFRYLNLGLGAILAFVGLKMLLSFFAEDWFHRYVPTWASLVAIIGILTVTIAASLAADKRELTGAADEETAGRR